MKKRLPQAQPKGRSCGQCNECCTALGVPEIQKTTFHTCSHVVEHKCDIYANRPEVCRIYKCAWLQDVLPGPERPDRVGVVIDRTQSTLNLEKRIGAVVYTARITRPGPDADEVIRRLSVDNVVIIVDASDKRRIVGPPRVMPALQAIKQEGVNSLASK